MRFNILVLTCLTYCSFAMLVSCSSSLYVPTSADASPATSLEELTEGRRIYIERCSGCHPLYQPAQISEERLGESLDKMQERSKVTNDEKALIFKYLVTGRPKQSQ
jgi:hypothetical protein